MRSCGVDIRVSYRAFVSLCLLCVSTRRHKGTKAQLAVSSFGFELPDRVLQFVHLTPDLVELLVVLGDEELLPLDLQLLNFVLQIGFGVNDGVGEMRMGLFNAEDL